MTLIFLPAHTTFEAMLLSPKPWCLLSRPEQSGASDNESVRRSKISHSIPSSYEFLENKPSKKQTNKKDIRLQTNPTKTKYCSKFKIATILTEASSANVYKSQNLKTANLPMNI